MDFLGSGGQGHNGGGLPCPIRWRKVEEKTGEFCETKQKVVVILFDAGIYHFYDCTSMKK